MSVLTLCKQEIRRSFDFRGRMSRPRYLTFLAVSVFCFAALFTFGTRTFARDHQLIFVLLVTAVFYFPVTSAGVRRLHDIGETGLHMLEPLKPAAILLSLTSLLWLSFIGTTVGRFIGLFTVMFFSSAILLLAAIASLATIFVTLAYFSHTMGLLLLPSQPGPNKYGPNPHEVPT